MAGLGGWLYQKAGQLERFQDKWIPVIRFENATKQRLRACVMVQPERILL